MQLPLLLLLPFAVANALHRRNVFDNLVAFFGSERDFKPLQIQEYAQFTEKYTLLDKPLDESAKSGVYIAKHNGNRKHYVAKFVYLISPLTNTFDKRNKLPAEVLAMSAVNKVPNTHAIAYHEHFVGNFGQLTEEYAFKYVIVMEHLSLNRQNYRWYDLQDYLVVHLNGPLPETAALTLFADMVASVQAMMRANVLHNDIKRMPVMCI